jgi:uncharacterized protein
MPVLYMIIFLVVVLSVYAAGHLYVYKAFVNVWTLPPVGQRVLFGTMIFFWISPLTIGLGSRYFPGMLTSALAHVGYTWMGFLFLFFVAHLVLVMLNYFFGRWDWDVNDRLIWIAAAALAFAGVVWGSIDAGRLRVRNEEVALPTLQLGQRIRMVHVTDLHFGPTLGTDFSRKVVDLVREQNPDLVVCTGDFLDPGIADPEGLARQWRELKPTLGKFAVLGNHEAYSDVGKSVKLLEDAGFVVLRNTHVQPVPGLVLAGVDDPAVAKTGEKPAVSELDLMRSLPRPSSVILLKHQPRVESRGLFDLQLSGHTHGGQLFPFNTFVGLVYKYFKGRYELPGGGTIIVSAGAGTWGPPIRLFVPPEIHVIDLVARPTR